MHILKKVGDLNTQNLLDTPMDTRQSLLREIKPEEYSKNLQFRPETIVPTYRRITRFSDYSLDPTAHFRRFNTKRKITGGSHDDFRLIDVNSSSLEHCSRKTRCQRVVSTLTRFALTRISLVVTIGVKSRYTMWAKCFRKNCFRQFDQPLHLPTPLLSINQLTKLTGHGGVCRYDFN